MSGMYSDSGSGKRLYLICVFLMAVVFTMDLNLPLGVAGGVPYVAVILVALWSPKKKLAIYLALICSIMTLLGFYLSPPGGELWKVLFNRGLALFAIWITAFLVFKWKSFEEELFSLEKKIEAEKEKIYVATIHSSQHIINNLLNQLILVKSEANRNISFDKRILKIFDNILIEASSLMKDLSEVHYIDEEVIRQAIFSESKSKSNT